MVPNQSGILRVGANGDGSAFVGGGDESEEE
jgi:hypothetical protein